MRKCIIILLLVLAGFYVQAQVYNNEWIDHSKTYYKFKVGATGLYRINQNALAAAGLGSIPAEQFQLWRNGQQQPIYTSTATGVLPANGYIEFWGMKNDGKPDKALYKNTANQLSDALSLETDTAAYFLTVNTAGNNARIVDEVNNVAGNTLAAEPYFMYDYRVDFQQNINYGLPQNYGEYVYSSTYDVGEFWSTTDIYPGSAFTQNAGNLYVAVNGPSASFKMSAAGNSFLGINPGNLGQYRTVQAYINNVKVIDSALAPVSAGIFTNNAIAPSVLNGTDISVNIKCNNTWNSSDRIAAGFININYPRLFNFGGATNFAFTLPASANGNYLEITNFSAGAATPVLYDLTNGMRYAANTSTTGIFKFALPPSAVVRSLVLVSEDASAIALVNNLNSRNFVDYSNTSQQGDYLIITNKIFTAGDNVAGQYQSYRNSAAGGGYKAVVYDIDELVDQFAFGIKKHPLSIKNFLKYARNRFAAKPKFCLLIGKAVTYNEYRLNEQSKYAEQLNLVPTFGWPASDNLLASDNLEPVPATYIGRISAIVPAEVSAYLNKIKAFEQQQASTLQTIDNKAWMKNMIHVVGANSDPGLDQLLTADENRYANIISGPKYGANIYSFNTTTVSSAYAATQLLQQLFTRGVSIINYFGHSAATTLDYNLGSWNTFSNPGKYPLFIVNGCNAGNIYSFDTTRLASITSLSEGYVLYNNGGGIGFIASTHFGVENYLDTYNTGFYNNLASAGYGKSVAENMQAGLLALVKAKYSGGNDSISYVLHAEENVLHGDPALKVNAHAKPDFVVEDPQVSISPTFISVADNSFNVKAYLYNIGQVLPAADSLSVRVTRQYPDGSKAVVLTKKIASLRYIDSLTLTIPIVPTRDKGQNELTVTVDYDSAYSELSETNNSITKTFYIYEDELTPIYPYNYAIINKSSSKLIASTANAIVPQRQYIMELDTTALFNSSFKITKTVTSVGGEIEFEPGITYTDSTVYYWRVAPVPTSGQYIWNNSSFVYIAGSSYGFNQSHVYQHLKSATTNVFIDSTSRQWNYSKIMNTFRLTNTVFNPNSSSQNEDGSFAIIINNIRVTVSACLGHSVIFNVFDPVTLKPLYNQPVPSVTGYGGAYGSFMQSAPNCADRNHVGTEFNFEFAYNTVEGRNQMAAFMNWVPAGYLVTARVIINEPYDAQTFAPAWKADPLVNGTNFYLSLKNAGFAGLDDYSFTRAWVFAYKKNTPSFAPAYAFTRGSTDVLDTTLNIATPDMLGYITSPAFGPAKNWKQVKWRGSSLDAKAGDNPSVEVIGVSATGTQTVLYTLNAQQQDADISSVSTTAYPYIMLRMRNADSINLTPYQLRYWRLLYDPIPEGALAPNILYTFNDTLGEGQTSKVSIAFKNVSDVAFADSIKVKMVLYNAGNVANVLPAANLKKLNPGDTAVVSYTIDTKSFSGLNNFYLDVNPANAQPEQFHFNNFFYRNMFVQTDKYKPTLDITFDGTHILNQDIVAATPHIMVKLKDESKYLLLNDTSMVTVQLLYPDGTLKRFAYNTDTLRFTPANAGGADNVAQVDFLPHLAQDGIYTLYVSGKDQKGNAAGSTSYTVSFMVYNKPMISNVFNYPNPFTTSTAFVFTITGSEVPQNLRIQILTITGKIVRDITKEELGPLHIGRNITEFKWNGTDQYGQKLANGIYLYRVITNLNNHALDKFPTYDASGNQVNTDQYFNKGYGKMYLMR